jgi:hypothetical protein
MNAQFRGNARGPRVRFGVATKQSFLVRDCFARFEHQTKVRNREDALATTRGGSTPQV